MVIKTLPKLTRDTDPQPKEDNFVKLVGHFGKWQLLIFLSIFLIKFPSGWIQLCIVFLTSKPSFWCESFKNNVTYVGEKSKCYDDCVVYGYDASPMEQNIVAEWDLICDKAWLASFTQTMLQLGILIGSVFFGFLADRYGRKYTFLLSIIIMTGVSLGVPFSPNYIVFTVLRFLIGFAVAGTMVVSFVIIMEVIGPKYREIIGCLYQVPFIAGHMSVALVAYFFRTWENYLLVLGITNLVFLVYFFTVNESPRWLLSVGRIDDATAIITRAAKMNKLPTENLQETIKKLSLEMQSNSDAPKLNYSALLRPELRVRTICSLIMWLVAGHTFFGFNQYIGQSSPDPFLSVTVAGLVQLPANFATIVLMRLVGRKTTAITSFLICGVSIIALGLVPQIFWLTLTLAAVGNGFASVVANCIYVYTSELFPTVVRNMGIGISSMAMRIGSMLAPFVASLGTSVFWLPTAILGTAPILAGMIVFLLPETKGKKLPDCIEDIKGDT